MKAMTVSCNHCGAPLDVEEATRFVTCAYCSTRLEVRRTENSVYTSLIEGIDSRTQQIADSVETIRLQNQVEQLDREWMLERERHMIHGKHGSRLPTRGGQLIGAAMLAVFGLIFAFFTCSRGTGFASILGIGVIIGAIVMAATGLQAADDYARAERLYQSRRRALLDQIKGS